MSHLNRGNIFRVAGERMLTTERRTRKWDIVFIPVHSMKVSRVRRTSERWQFQERRFGKTIRSAKREAVTVDGRILQLLSCASRNNESDIVLLFSRTELLDRAYNFFP